MRRRWRAWKIDPRDFFDARRHALLSVDQVADLLHVHPKTVSKWERGLHRIPYPAYKLLRVLRRYELPEACWNGWEARNGALWSPAGHRFTPGDLAWLSLTFRRAEAFTEVRRQLQALRSATRQQVVASATSSVVISQGPAPEGPHKRLPQGDPSALSMGRGQCGRGESQRVLAPGPLVDQCPLLEKPSTTDRGLQPSFSGDPDQVREGRARTGKEEERSDEEWSRPHREPHERSVEKTERAAAEQRERIASPAPDAATLHADTGEETWLTS